MKSERERSSWAVMSVRGCKADCGKGGVEQEAEFHVAVDAAGHGVFEGEVRGGEHGAVDGWDGRIEFERRGEDVHADCQAVQINEL